MLPQQRVHKLIVDAGGKHFSRNLQPLNADGEVENMWAVGPLHTSFP
jgi:hypothetical protein